MAERRQRPGRGHRADGGARHPDTLINIAGDASPDGYACQITAATNDPLPRPYPGVREIHIDTDNRFFDHAPRRDT